AAVKPLTMQQQESAPPRAVRHRLPSERASITHKFALAGHEGYITVGLYKDGTPGELFIRMAKEGSTVSGLMDSFATAVSLALQHGVPMKLLCDKFSHTRFEPSGFTGNPEIPSPRASWTTSSAGWNCVSSPDGSIRCSKTWCCRRWEPERSAVSHRHSARAADWKPRRPLMLKLRRHKEA
ncbi:MAG: ribonucleoside-diphosphate reductase, adenosylcobalamin-dependent, partial [Candidatus Angelobacter sp.]|nr:ribonucleoside-diphosphate reductase, adenosylcobalamin-dependent [Candidatus Angelobacter sp.]